MIIDCPVCTCHYDISDTIPAHKIGILVCSECHTEVSVKKQVVDCQIVPQVCVRGQEVIEPIAPSITPPAILSLPQIKKTRKPRVKKEKTVVAEKKSLWQRIKNFIFY